MENSHIYRWLSLIIPYIGSKTGIVWQNCSIFPSFSHSFPKSWGFPQIFLSSSYGTMKFTLPGSVGIPHGYRDLQIFHDGYPLVI